MAKKSVTWTQTAIRQRRDILKYWNERNHSSTYAEKLVLLIKDRVNFIVENPDAGKLTSHLDTREAAMGNFSIYYKITESTIYIIAFWDNRQDPDKLAKKLLEA